MATKIEPEPENIFKQRVKNKNDLMDLVKTFHGMSLSDLEDWVNENFAELSKKARQSLLMMLKVLWALIKKKK